MRMLLIFVLGLSFPIQSFASDSGIFGKWALPSTVIDSHKYSIFLEVNPVEVIITGICEKDGAIATARVKAPAFVTKTSIDILQSRSMTVHENGLDCQVTANNGSLSYVLLRNGKRLRMLPLGTLSDLTRVN